MADDPCACRRELAGAEKLIPRERWIRQVSIVVVEVQRACKANAQSPWELHKGRHGMPVFAVLACPVLSERLQLDLCLARFA